MDRTIDFLVVPIDTIFASVGTLLVVMTSSGYVDGEVCGVIESEVDCSCPCVFNDIDNTEVTDDECSSLLVVVGRLCNGLSGNTLCESRSSACPPLNTTDFSGKHFVFCVDTVSFGGQCQSLNSCNPILDFLL